MLLALHFLSLCKGGSGGRCSESTKEKWQVCDSHAVNRHEWAPTVFYSHVMETPRKKGSHDPIPSQCSHSGKEDKGLNN